MGKKFLFTGGTGFLGKNVMPLLQKDYEVTTCGITSEDIIKVTWLFLYQNCLYSMMLCYMLPVRRM